MTRNPLSLVLIALIRVYRLIPKRASHCRFHPSCSAYGLEAIQVHGPLRGSWLTLRRIGRCNPWGGTGNDPVPPPRHQQLDPNSQPPAQPLAGQKERA